MAARNNQLVYVGLFMAAMGLVLGFDAWAWLMSGSTHDASYAGPDAGPGKKAGECVLVVVPARLADPLGERRPAELGRPDE